MPANPLGDFSRLCLHTITTRPWSIEEATERYAAAGVTVWRQWLEGRDIAGVGRGRAAGSKVVSLCRGGFFPAFDAAARRRRSTTTSGPSTKPHALGRTADRAGLRRRAGPGSGSLARTDRRRHCRRAGSGPGGRRAAGHRAAAPHVRRRPFGHQHPAPGQRPVRPAGLAARWASCVDVYHVWWDPDLQSRDRALRPGGPAARLPRLRLADADRGSAERPRPDGRRLHPHPPDPRLGRAGRVSRLHRSGNLLQSLLGDGPGAVRGANQRGPFRSMCEDDTMA